MTTITVERELLERIACEAMPTTPQGMLDMSDDFGGAIKELRALLAEQPQARFNLGDRVRKTKGSQWNGTVVGTYSTELTPEGYAVESSTEKGSVQIYPAAALEMVQASAAQAAPAGAGDASLDGRMRAAGMLTVAELLAGAPLDDFIKHADVNDLPSLLQWAEMRRAECLRMQARYDLGERDKNDDLYEWTIAHCAVFTELHVNIRAALAARQEQGDEVRRLREAAQKVISHVEGDLPIKGWLRDNDASREALGELRACLAAIYAQQQEGKP